MGIILLCGLAVVLALHVAIHLRIAGIPDRAAARAAERIERAFAARPEAEANAIEQATTKRVSAIVKELEAVAEDMRGRGTDLRGIHDEQAELLIALRDRTTALAGLCARASAPPPAAEPEEAQRATVEMERPPSSDDEPEELTQVAKKPIADTTGAPNGLRLGPSRPAIPPPPSGQEPHR